MTPVQRDPEPLFSAPPSPAWLTDGCVSRVAVLAGGTLCSKLGIKSAQRLATSREGFPGLFSSQSSHSQFQVIHCFLVLKDWKRGVEQMINSLLLLYNDYWSTLCQLSTFLSLEILWSPELQGQNSCKKWKWWRLEFGDGLWAVPDVLKRWALSQVSFSGPWFLPLFSLSSPLIWS